MKERTLGRRSAARRRLQEVIDLYGYTLTARDLAEKANVHESTIYRIEKELGHKISTPPTLKYILLDNADPNKTIDDYYLMAQQHINYKGSRKALYVNVRRAKVPYKADRRGRPLKDNSKLIKELERLAETPETIASYRKKLSAKHAKYSYEYLRKQLKRHNIPFVTKSSGPSFDLWLRKHSKEEQSMLIALCWLKRSQLAQILCDDVTAYRADVLRKRYLPDFKRYRDTDVLIDLASIGSAATAAKHNLEEEVLDDISYIADFGYCPYTDRAVTLDGFLANEYPYYVEEAKHV